MAKLTPEQQRRLDTIQALLRKAEDGASTPEESEALTAKALALASQYQIEEAFIQAGGSSTDEIEFRNGEVGRPYNQLMTLAHVVYKFSGCKLVKLTADPDANIWDQIEGKAADGTKYRNEKYTVVGFTSDLDRGLMLLTSLLVQGARSVVSDYRNSGQRERRSTYYRSWWTAFTNEIFTRLEVIRGQQVVEGDRTHGSGTELVLASRSDLVARAVNERFGGLKRGGRGRGVSGSGGDAGAAAGRRADIGGKKITGTTRAIER